MQLGARTFAEVWAADFEFRALAGERPQPHCLVARELVSGRTVRLFGADLSAHACAPFDVGPNSLFVAFYAAAEMSCFLSLGWSTPTNVLDLFAEFRVLTNGRPYPHGAGLLGAMTFYGLPCIDVAEKKEMRELAIRGGPFTTDERAALLRYCETDVDALDRLFPVMAPVLDLEHALLRGRFVVAVAHIEHVGVPLDLEIAVPLRAHWEAVQGMLIERIDQTYRVYEGRSFRVARFGDWLQRNGIPWPRLSSGVLDLADDTFKDLAQTYPAVRPLRELRQTLSEMRLNDLAIGADGRNRCMLSPFRARTGRNQPSNSKFIFGTAAWLRGLIKPEPGNALAYIDWSQQEFGIAAALSNDEVMKAAYRSGDPYLEFAKQAGAVPPTATKKSHAAVREQFKQCALGVQYSMGETSLAARLGRSPADARELLRLHRATYPRFWRWSESAVNYGMLHGRLWTTFGWKIQVGPDVNPRSLGNFPMQANGAEMLRLACCLGTERGIRICAPVHDAVLIEAPLDELDAKVAEMQRAMEEASGIVLGGFFLRSDVSPVRYPARYMDQRGATMWGLVLDLLTGIAGDR